MSTMETDSRSSTSRSQFTMRDLLVQVAFISVILGLLATRSPIFVVWVPTVACVAFLFATHGAVKSAVVSGFVGVALIFVAARTADLQSPSPDLLEVFKIIVLTGPLGAWFFASMQAIVNGSRRIGVLALVLFFLFVTALNYIILSETIA